MIESIENRIRAVPWSTFSHPCQQQQCLIPELLLHIGSATNDEESRYEAALKLWDVAAHQGIIGPSALPTGMFILEMLDTLPRIIQVEVLDTLYQFSISVLKYRWNEWSEELLKVLELNLPLLQSLLDSPEEDVRVFAEMIIGNVEEAQAEQAASSND